ncbi:hypothetical protein [Arthrobacter sp. Helios]|uniref:hypothetical protein n=1 Tax=Arthrobacter sp. Helios TaxID=2828862 RepID=UPI002045BB17|nr:hypothetical protein [Arthrobacter sp. Helios]UPO76864.1 hypothetical protein ArtHe_16310 [Arthrobacter sp. Helios]
MTRILGAFERGTPNNRPFRTLIVAAAVVVGMPALAGCQSIFRDDPPCLPPEFSASPASATVGGQVTVAADDSECNPRYGQDASIKITVTDSAGNQVIDTTAPMNDAGGFTYTFNVPASTAPGAGSIVAYPDGIDWCDDTGRNNRAQVGPHNFALVSCVMPQVAIAILP